MAEVYASLAKLSMLMIVVDSCYLNSTAYILFCYTVKQYIDRYRQ